MRQGSEKGEKMWESDGAERRENEKTAGTECGRIGIKQDRKMMRDCLVKTRGCGGGNKTKNGDDEK